MKKINILYPVKEEGDLFDLPSYRYLTHLVIAKNTFDELDAVLSNRITKMPNGTNLYVHDKSYPQSRIRNWMKNRLQDGLIYNIVRKPSKATCVMVEKKLLKMVTKTTYAMKVEFANELALLDKAQTELYGEYYINVPYDSNDPNFSKVDFPASSDNKIYKFNIVCYVDPNGKVQEVQDNYYDTVIGDLLDIAAISEESELDVSYITTDDLHAQIDSKEGITYDNFLTLRSQLNSEQEHQIEIASSVIAEHNFAKSAYWLSLLPLEPIKKSYSMSLTHNSLFNEKLRNLNPVVDLLTLNRVLTAYKNFMTFEQKHHAAKLFKQYTYNAVLSAINNELRPRTYGINKSNDVFDDTNLSVNIDLSVVGLGDITEYSFLKAISDDDTKDMGEHEHQHYDAVETVR